MRKVVPTALHERPKAGAGGTRTIAIVLKGYPRLSETFIAQEIHALEQRGLSLALFSLRRPTDAATHPVHAEIKAPVTYLPEYLHHDVRRVWRAWRSVRRSSAYRAARSAWLGWAISARLSPGNSMAGACKSSPPTPMWIRNALPSWE